MWYHFNVSVDLLQVMLIRVTNIFTLQKHTVGLPFQISSLNVSYMFFEVKSIPDDLCNPYSLLCSSPEDTELSLKAEPNVS